MSEYGSFLADEGAACKKKKATDFVVSPWMCV